MLDLWMPGVPPPKLTHVLLAAAVQVASRIWALWGIIELVPDSTTRGSITLLKIAGFKAELSLVSLLLAWSVSEILRYTFYVFKVTCPPYSPYRPNGTCLSGAEAGACNCCAGV